jgi:hypothetical protein
MNFRDKIKCRIAPNKGGEAEGHNLHAKASQHHISKSPMKENHDPWENDVRNIIRQARVNRSRYEWDEGNYEDKEIEMGVSCFTCRVRRTEVPKGFKLPHDQQKYDRS